MSSNITINNGQVCSPNFMGNELIFFKRPLIIKKPTTTNINNISQNNKSNSEQNHGSYTLYDQTTSLQKSQVKPSTATNNSGYPFNQYQRESSLHSSGQQRNSFILTDRQVQGQENKEKIYGGIKQQNSQVIHIQQQRAAQNQAISQRYTNNNSTINQNKMNTNTLIKRPPSASLNSKKKQQITVYQHQQQSFISSLQNQSHGLQKKHTSESQNQINRGNMLSYKQKQKIISELYSQEKNLLSENFGVKQEDYPKYLLDQSNDVRQIVYAREQQKTHTQRLLKERNDQQQVNNSKVKAIYQNAIGYSKQKSNSALRVNLKQPQQYLEPEDFYKLKQSNNNDSLERQQIQNKSQLANSYLIESNILQSPQQIVGQKSLQNLTTTSKLIKTNQLDKLIQSTNHKNYEQYQLFEQSTSPYMQQNQNRQDENNQKNSSSYSPQKMDMYVEESDIQDDKDTCSQQLQNSYVEIFASDFSKFKSTALRNESQSPINEEKMRNSSDSIDSFKQKRLRKNGQNVQQLEKQNKMKNQSILLNQKQARQNKILDLQKNAKLVQQEPPSKVLSEADDKRISQLKYKLLENNEKTTARKILVKKKSTLKQKSGYISQQEDKIVTDRELQQEQYQQQKGISENNQQTFQAKKNSKRGSVKLKKSDSNLGSTSQTELRKRQSQKIENESNPLKEKRKFSESRDQSIKKPPLPLTTAQKTPKVKQQGEDFEEEEEDDFSSLSNLSEMDKQFDDLQFEDNEEEEIQERQSQPRKISLNSLVQNKDNNIKSISELANQIKSNQIENKIIPTVTLLKSVYEGRPSTIFFEYPDCCFKKRARGDRTYTASEKEAKRWNLTYRMNDCNRPYQCVTRSFESGGFVQTYSNTTWNGYWASNRISFIKKLNSYQKTNHFAGCWNLGRKDLLWLNVSKSKRKFNTDYDFVPKTMLLGQEWDKFTTLLEDSPEKIWIVKPVASCCGKGIHVVQKKCKISKRKRKHYLASEYISNPHLINDTKYDLRIYVLVTSYDPLRIYMFEDGLVRFATEKYNLTTNGHQRQRFMHLTNYSVNKKSDNFIKNNDVNDSGFGSKWSLKAWKEYLISTIGEEGKEQLVRRMEDVIIKTCISVEPFMNDSSSKTSQHRNNCFELYGFDILIDDTLKPWLLEVNVCPSLSSSSPLDRKIKTSLISDIFNTLGFIPYDKKKLIQEKKFHNVTSKKKKVRYSINNNKLSEIENSNLNILSPNTSSIPSNILSNPSTVQNNLNGTTTILMPINQLGSTTISGFQFSNTTTSFSNSSIPFSEDKRTFSKNIKDIVDLNENNCFQKLSQDDWEVLFEADEERYRSGEFRRIFPPNDLNLIDYYGQFFLFPRYNNIMVWNYLKSNVNILEYICQKNSTLVC